MIPIVTIDGPSGAGKGTICRIVAQKAGYKLLDSGALYRLVALACLQHQIDLDDQLAVAGAAEQLDIRFEIEHEKTHIFMADVDVTAAIRREQVGMTASKVAAYPAVRAALLQRQRDFSASPGLVADGRDMGTVVFPDAGVKIYLTASAEERARRRINQLAGSASAPSFDEILRDIQARDAQDKNRASAPLTPADDAIQIDSTGMSIGEVANAVMMAINKAYGDDKTTV